MCSPGENEFTCPADCFDSSTEVCWNGLDDDGDGRKDCDDPDCFDDPSCRGDCPPWMDPWECESDIE